MNTTSTTFEDAEATNQWLSLKGMKEDRLNAALSLHLNKGETLKHSAFGISQPNLFLIFLLMLLGIIPGVIAMVLLTRNYIIGMTDKRLLILQIKSATDAGLKRMMEYDLDELSTENVSTSAGALFTKISIKDGDRPFKAKFHRAFSKTNRADSIAIAEAISK